MSNSFEGQTDKTEEWYGTQYKQEAISEESLQVSAAPCPDPGIRKAPEVLGRVSLGLGLPGPYCTCADCYLR